MCPGPKVNQTTYKHTEEENHRWCVIYHKDENKLLKS